MQFAADILIAGTSAASALTFTAKDLLHGCNNIVLTDRSGGAETEGNVFVGGDNNSSGHLPSDETTMMMPSPPAVLLMLGGLTAMVSVARHGR